MKHKHIVVCEWMTLQPYESSKSTDIYYTNLSTRCTQYLEENKRNPWFGHNDNIRRLSVYLTAWFDNIISETGL